MDCIDHGCKGFGIGYATAYYRSRCGKKKYTTKHRVVYCKHHGLHPEDLSGDVVVRHKCDNARCINPLHMEVGTHQDNMDDMASRGRRVNTPGLKGEESPRCKVMDTDCREMLDLRTHTRFSLREIGEMYGIGISQVHRITRGETRGNKA